MTLDEGGETRTLATGMRVIVNDTVSLTPSALTATRAVPRAIPVTRPVDEIEAVVGVKVDHETTRPDVID